MEAELPRSAWRSEWTLCFSSRGRFDWFWIHNVSGLLALFGFSEYQPIAVLSSAVVRILPLRVNDWPFADLNDAVTGSQPHLAGSVDEVYVCPLIPMVMNIVGKLAEQDAFGFENSVSLFRKWRERVRKGVLIFFG